MKRNNENGDDGIACVFCEDFPLFLYLVLSKNDCHSLVFLQYFEQMSFLGNISDDVALAGASLAALLPAAFT